MSKFLSNKYAKNLLIFFICWLFYGIIANVWIQFPDWDWYNYQHYNAWAFLNDRLGTDFLAGNYRSYFNPYLNTVQYLLLMKLNNHPRLFLFLSTIDGALLLFLAYKIADILFSAEKKYKTLLISLSLLYVALAPIMYEVLDFSRYDGHVAVLELLSFYILLKNIFCKDSPQRTFLIVISGILSGLAVTLKLTGIVFCISTFLSLLIVYRKIQNPIKILLIYLTSSLMTFVLTDSYWLYTLYEQFRNPFFPYFNDIFNSKYYDSLSVYNTDYIHLHPKNLLQYLFYPFIKSNDALCFGCDDRFWDARYAINVIGLIAFYMIAKFKKVTLNSNVVFFSAFLFLTYYVDIAIFSSYRFILPISILFGISLLYFIFFILKTYTKEFKYKFVFLLFIPLIIFVYINQDLGYKHFLPKNHGKILKVLSVKDFELKDNSVVFLTPSTSAYIVGQNKNVQYLGYDLSKEIFNKRKMELDFEKDLWFNAFYLHSKILENRISDILNSSQNAYIIINDKIWFNYMPVYKESLHHYTKNRTLKNCKELPLLLFGCQYFPVQLCEIK